MKFERIDIGTLSVQNIESVRSMRKKIASVCAAVGFSDVDSTRIGLAMSELGRKILSIIPGSSVCVWVEGDDRIESILLTFPYHQQFEHLLSNLNYFVVSQFIKVQYYSCR